MAKKTRKKSRWLGFWVFCLVFALLFSIGTFYALEWLEGQLQLIQAQNDAKDNARPELAKDAYLAQLDADYVADHLLDDLYAQVDSRLQSREEARAVVLKELSQGIGCQVSFTSADKQIFTLYSKNPIEGKYPQIGSFTIAPNGQTVHGYTPWGFVEDSFNMDYLLGEPAQITVPHTCTVWWGNKLLPTDCITESGIGYEVLAKFPKGLNLPTKTTYSAGPVLGQITLQARDGAGNPVLLDENTDWTQFIHNCTPEQEAQLTKLIQAFLKDYVLFTSSSTNIYANYRQVITHMVPNGELANRMRMAQDGLQWIYPYPDTLLGTQYHHMIDLGDGSFICDISYTVKTLGRQGNIELTTPIQLIFVPVDGTLKLKDLILY